MAACGLRTRVSPEFKDQSVPDLRALRLFRAFPLTHSPTIMVVDTKYYDILQVETDADELAIKKVLLLLYMENS